jgi:hypothetical protein
MVVGMLAKGQSAAAPAAPVTTDGVTRPCESCSQPIPADGGARTCGRCRTAAYRERQRLPQLLRLLDRWPLVDVDAVRAAAAGWTSEQLQAAVRHAQAVATGLEGLWALIPADVDPATVTAETVTPVVDRAPAVADTGRAETVTADRVTALTTVAAPIPPARTVAPAAGARPPARGRAMVAGLRPTAEQQAILDACAAGGNLVIEAGAGTGKTSTLRMAATVMRGRGLYIAFNRSIAQDAKRSFPGHVQCATAHALAFRAIGHLYAHRLPDPKRKTRLAYPTGVDAAALVGIVGPLQLGADNQIGPKTLYQYVVDTVKKFCRTTDQVIGRQHVPEIEGLSALAAAALADVAVPAAQAVWADACDVDGRLKFEHDYYLKMWQLSGPKLDADFVMLDEAQDADPVIAAVVQAQTGQLVAVGDSCQAIYGWRGAVDAIATWPTRNRLYLSQSWRFGERIADEANKWLSLLGGPLRLTGTPSIRSTVAPLARPDAVLCRTNSEAFSQTIIAMEAGRRAGLTGGAHAIISLAEAAVNLMADKRTEHPELVAFANWGEVQEHVKDEHASVELTSFVRLVDDLGAPEILAAARRLTDERNAEVIVSTTHKAKGREWPAVLVARDFRTPNPDRPGQINRPEAMLAYVAVTRAQHTLDRGSLAAIDDVMALRLTGRRTYAEEQYAEW